MGQGCERAWSHAGLRKARGAGRDDGRTGQVAGHPCVGQLDGADVDARSGAGRAPDHEHGAHPGRPRVEAASGAEGRGPTMSTNRPPVGEARPSQLLWTYGPGALIDLPILSVVTLGIDQWEKDRCQPIVEPRLLAAVRKGLGAQVESLRMPPFQKSEPADPRPAEANTGVPVRPFPRCMRCINFLPLPPLHPPLLAINA